MRLLPYPAKHEDVLAFLWEWLECLSREDYDGAHKLLFNPRYSGRPLWTPSLIKTLVENYGSTEPHYTGLKYRVTLGEEFNAFNYSSHEKLGVVFVKHNRYPIEIEWNYPEKGLRYLGMVHLDYWLTTEANDLSSEFHIRKFGRHTVLELERIEVM